MKRTVSDGFPDREGRDVGRVCPIGNSIPTKEEEEAALALEERDLIPARDFIKKFREQKLRVPGPSEVQ